LTAANYAVCTFIDYSFEYFVFIRILVGALSYLYFFHLVGHIYTKLGFDKKRGYPTKFKKTGWSIIPGILFFIHLISVTSATDYINDFLVRSKNSLTFATIKDCHKSRGTEYCVCSYLVDNKYYAIKYNNEPTSLKLKEGDTTSILYYPNIPQIGRLKKEWF